MKNSKRIGAIDQLSPSTYVRDCSEPVRKYLQGIGHCGCNLGATTVWVRYGKRPSPVKGRTSKGPIAVGPTEESVTPSTLPETEEIGKEPEGAPVQAAAEEGNLSEQPWRTLLFLEHGCEGKYGDDGEMQCNRYVPLLDFKRDSILRLTDGCFIHQQVRASRQNQD